MSTTPEVSEVKVTDEDAAPDHQVTLPVATKFEFYMFVGDDRWWARITKGQAKKLEVTVTVRKGIYGDDSIGWFVLSVLGPVIKR